MSLLQHRQLEIIRRHEEAAFGDAAWRDAGESPRQFAGVEMPGKRLREGLRNRRHLRRRFVREFQSKMTDARRQPRFQVRGSLLRLGTEDSVAATDVSHHGMRAAARVS